MSDHTPLERRNFLSRLGVSAAAFGAAFTAGAALPSLAAAQRAPKAGHPEDAWLDDMKGMHKIVYDGVSIETGHNVWFYARNFLNANNKGYNMKDSDCAVVASLRHYSTCFAFNDAMWAKYPIGELAKMDSKPKANPYAADAKEMAGRGVVMSVCGLATEFFSGILAKQVGANAADVQKDLSANLVVAPAHIMAAGVVAVNRAQEHGFTYTYVG